MENDSQTFAIGVGCSSFQVFRVRVLYLELCCKAHLSIYLKSRFAVGVCIPLQHKHTFTWHNFLKKLY